MVGHVIAPSHYHFAVPIQLNTPLALPPCLYTTADLMMSARRWNCCSQQQPKLLDTLLIGPTHFAWQQLVHRTPAL